jgi:glycosidase
MTDVGNRISVTRAARERYGLSREILKAGESAALLDLRAARAVTQRINEVRQAHGAPPDQSLSAGELNAISLIQEIFHIVAQLYGERIDPTVKHRALSFARERLGDAAVDDALLQFLDIFPTSPVMEGSLSPTDFLARTVGGTSGRETLLGEMMLLTLANSNPAFLPFHELFNDAALRRSAYPALFSALSLFYQTEPAFGPDDQDLVTMLQSPVRASPNSLAGQLEYIRRRWGALLGDHLVRLLTGMDLLREESKLGFGPFSPGPPEVYDYLSQNSEKEAFSSDRDWMPRAVMMAKNALVWLDQLSRRYGREIRRLDQVPDEELDRLARDGFTALWLIGVWERSGASREIKRRMGNPEAEASAYSLDDYAIAAELGGATALESLRDRAWRRGIRMASDMVPNHTGLDSRWMAERPELFLSWPRPEPPFPSYSFNGPDISRRPEIGVYLEDHYWNRSDAAVVFKRVDHRTGASRLIYHGNDGTHMPWNDTAQLDFLNPATREAVIQTIIHVARMFPIIRFDAAMTLAKKHYQRLWYPEPGTGGDIASRAGNGMSRHDFDAAMPIEFWREVVDRVAREAPDTLLLAEAFWMLEGFFVRTLGMHRVYNSAFMHMLKAEDNAGYRQTLRNTLEFDPEVLKRFVNFMSNPDEQTAIEQFGDGDKYFGVCTLMATLPGLPMVAHGQLEGLKEKYGMEFRRSYWEETPSSGLLQRHEKDIFPLLRRRYLFAGVDQFLLYDFFTQNGAVNEDVFAYSNRQGDERALILYNNRYATTQGWVRTSVGFAVKSTAGRLIVQKCLGEGLALPNQSTTFVAFREQRSGLEFLRRCSELWEKGMFAALGPYQSQVFLDFRLVGDDSDGIWLRLYEELAGRGVASVDHALRELALRPVTRPLHAALAADPAVDSPGARRRFAELLAAVRTWAPTAIEEEGCVKEHDARLLPPRRRARATKKQDTPVRSTFLRAWNTLRPLSLHHAGTDQLLAWLQEWRWGLVIEEFLISGGWREDEARDFPALVELFEGIPTHRSPTLMADLLSKPAARRFLRVHEFDSVQWFSKEAFDVFLECLAALAAAEGLSKPDLDGAREAAVLSGYRYQELLRIVTPIRRRIPHTRHGVNHP